MLDGGLFSPNEILAKDFVMEAASSSDRVKTPHASDRPRMCIANVRFGDDTSPMAFDMKQREVAISPICIVMTRGQKRRRRPMFADSCKKQKEHGRSEEAGGLGLVTPSLSISSRTTIMTHPLTVCSSASSIRTTLTLEELSKVRSIQTNRSITGSIKNVEQPNNNDITTQTTPDCSGVEPKLITQESPPDSSPPFSTPPNFDMIDGSVLRSHKKLEIGTPADKFWSSVGGLDSFTPFRNLEERDGGSSLMSPTANSE